MYDKILVPVDFSPKNDAARASACAIAGRRDGCEVTLLHVIESIEHIEPGEMADFYSGLEARAEAKLHVLREELAAKGVRARHEVVLGKRAESVVLYAERNLSDLIVLSSHRVDAEHPALGFGTMSYRIAIIARCPVLLVK